MCPHDAPRSAGCLGRFRRKEQAGLYGDAIEEIDWSTGESGHLKELGLEKDTLVVFTSDNGPWLRLRRMGEALCPEGCKFTTYEGA